VRTKPHTISAASKINVTPLIDVVMVLIIFYLLVGKLAADRTTAVSLPSSGIGFTDTSSTGVTISITQRETGPSEIRVGEEPVTLSELPVLLRAMAAQAGPTSIRADRGLPFAEIRPVLDACREAGLTSVRLAAQREEAP